MKKINFLAYLVLIILLLVGCGDKSDKKIDKKIDKPKVTTEQKDLLLRLIKSNEYTCTSIERAIQSGYDGSWRVKCYDETIFDKESAYHIKETNTFWEVIKKY